jgi:hypothetical protein
VQLFFEAHYSWMVHNLLLYGRILCLKYTIHILGDGGDSDGEESGGSKGEGRDD